MKIILSVLTTATMVCLVSCKTSLVVDKALDNHQQSASITERELLENLPWDMLGYKREKLTIFGDERFGVATNYLGSSENHFNTLNIYVYDNGEGPIGSGLNSFFTRQAFAQALNEINYFQEIGVYHDVKENSKERIFIDGHEFVKSSLQYQVEIAEGDFRSVTSYILVTGIKGYILKIRLTGNTNLLTPQFINNVAKVCMDNF